MTTRLESSGWSKWSEVDDYKNGCEPATSIYQTGEERFTGDDPEAVIHAAAGFFGVTSPENILRDSCDEIGRVDFQVMETDDGFQAIPADMERWRRGDLRLWLSCYTIQIERVTRETVATAREAVPA